MKSFEDFLNESSGMNKVVAEFENQSGVFDKVQITPGSRSTEFVILDYDITVVIDSQYIIARDNKNNLISKEKLTKSSAVDDTMEAIEEYHLMNQ